jgi:release factor glutamine methyltransferase
MIPTPDLSHLTRHDLEQVYDPAEDTFLLLDALEQDAEALRKERPLICLELWIGMRVSVSWKDIRTILFSLPLH